MSAVEHHVKLLDMLRHLCAALDLSDASHEDFLDSNADVIEFLWTEADEARELLRELDGSP